MQHTKNKVIKKTSTYSLLYYQNAIDERGNLTVRCFIMFFSCSKLSLHAAEKENRAVCCDRAATATDADAGADIST